jgi:carbon-monoxide dehydrogenase medium subunit
MSSTKLYRPTTRTELLEVLDAYGEDAKVVSGGTAFSILWKSGLLRPGHVVSALRVPELAGLTTSAHEASLGALTRLRDLEYDEDVRRGHPVLAATLRLVANARVRNVATIGGNVAEADPTSDPPAVLSALDAVVHVASTKGEREVPFSEFVVDYFETSLAPEEIVTRVVVPAAGPGWGGTYLKFLSRSAEDRTCLGVAAFVSTDTDGRCSGLRLSVIGAHPVPLRLSEVEQSCLGEVLDDEVLRDLARRYVAAADPVSDVRGSEQYRKRVLGPLIARAVARASRGGNDAVMA